MKTRFATLAFILLAVGVAASIEDLITVYGSRPGLTVRRANGHEGFEGPVLSGDKVNGIYGRGYNGSAFTTSDSASVEIQATEDWTSTANGSKVVVTATQATEATAATVLQIGANGLTLLSDAAPRTNLTPLAAGTLVWNSGDDELCVSTGTVATSWVLVADGSTACSS